MVTETIIPVSEAPPEPPALGEARSRHSEVLSKMRDAESRHVQAQRTRNTLAALVAEQDYDAAEPELAPAERELLEAWAREIVRPLIEGETEMFAALDDYLRAEEAAKAARVRALRAREALYMRLRASHQTLPETTARLGKSLEPPGVDGAPPTERGLDFWAERLRNEFQKWRTTWLELLTT